MEQPIDNYPQPSPMGMGIPAYSPEEMISNIVGQIDPARIVDNLDHALKGEIYSKEKGMWEKNATGKPLVNDACRGAVISYISGILTNNTTMSILQEKQISLIMESVIETITKMFKVNLEEFGFVPRGSRFEEGVYENKGTPDTARMTQVANMVYTVVFLTLSRALKGMESRKVFGSLKMMDTMGYNPQEKSGNWLTNMFGKGR